MMRNCGPAVLQLQQIDCAVHGPLHPARLQIPETLSPEVLAKMHAPGPDESVPVADVQDLPNYDGFLIGVPTRSDSLRPPPRRRPNT